MNIVGLPDTAVQEAKERVLAALRDSGCEFPLRRITVNLAPADLKKKVGEYVADGRFFASIEMTEEEDMIKMVMDFLGDHVLMYASDYPHGESWFPISVETVKTWTGIPESAKKKLFWDNALRFYNRYGKV